MSVYDPGDKGKRRGTDLLLEVADRIVVCVREEVGDGREVLLDMILEMIHQVRPVPLEVGKSNQGRAQRRVWLPRLL